MFVNEFCIYLTTEKHYSENTARCYRADINALLKWAKKKGLDSNNITVQDMQMYLDSLTSKGYKASTLRRKVATASHYYKFLQNIGKRPDQLLYREKKLHQKLIGLKLPPLPERIYKEVDSDSFDIIMKNITEFNLLNPYKRWRDKVMIRLMWQYGISLSELLNCTINDLNLNTRTLIVRKKRSCQSYDLSDFIIEVTLFMKEREKLTVVRDQCLGENALFLNKWGHPISNRSMRRHLADYGNISPAKLRHSYVIRALRNGCSLESLKKEMSHQSLITTKIYAKAAIPKTLDTMIESWRQRYKSGHTKTVQ